MKNILVTGGCGFIGANFIRMALKQLPETRLINLDKLTYSGNLENLDGIDSSQYYRFIKGDICDTELLNRLFEEEKIDTVVHFAAESHVDRSIYGPAEFIQTNIHGTFSLLEATRAAWLDNKQGKRFLHVSTDEVYGSLGETGLFTESTAYDPHSPYSASKAAADHLVNAYSHTYGLPILMTNCSNNFGPYQFPEKLIPLIIYNALHGKELPIYGDGKNIRDWLFVEDNCRAILTVLQKGKLGERYNIGGNSEKQNIEVVRILCDTIDEKVKPLSSGEKRQSLIRFTEDRPGHDRRYAIDASRIKAELGWEPTFGFEEGICVTVDWYLHNSKWINSIIDGSYQEYYARI